MNTTSYLGCDEVGRGPWAGPVMACICATNTENDPLLKEVADSKTLSEKRRLTLNEALRESTTLHWSIGVSTVEEIDRLNILQATFLAMQRAHQGLIEHHPKYTDRIIIFDGSQKPPWARDEDRTEIKGDQRFSLISAASIIAKTERDALMTHYHAQEPYYSWNTNAGYGTKDHREGLEKHGLSKHHRLSYKPIQRYI